MLHIGILFWIALMEQKTPTLIEYIHFFDAAFVVAGGAGKKR